MQTSSENFIKYSIRQNGAKKPIRTKQSISTISKILQFNKCLIKIRLYASENSEDASSFVKIGRKNLPMKVKPSKVVVLSKEENGGLKWLNKLPKGTQLD